MTNSGVPYSAASVRDRDAGDRHLTVAAANGVARPHVRRERQQLGRRLRARGGAGRVHLLGVARSGGMGVHIRSGAVTPRMSEAVGDDLTGGLRTAPAGRVCSSLGSSSPCGSTRQES